LLNFVPEPEASFISARVVADSTGAFAQSLLLNVGSFAGVGKDQLVLTGEGLVGRIIGVSQRASRVLLITDISSKIPVFVGPSRVRAVLAGDNTGRPKLTRIVGGEVIKPGDQVVTSGIAGVFPPGLPVGVVDQVDEARISVSPNVERDRLEYVRVVDYGIDSIHIDPPMAMKPGEPKGAADKPSVRADAR
jgi:rod shape-determining protein MreC